MSDDRKARLAALAAKAGRSQTGPEINDDEQNSETIPASTTAPKTIRFRNYTPSDPTLLSVTKKNDDDDNDKLPAAKRYRSETTTTPDARNQKSASSTVIEQGLLKTKAELNNTNASSVTELAQSSADATSRKKLNGDLKRDIQPKLDKLERRTQKAIIELLRMRLEKEAEVVPTADDID